MVTRPDFSVLFILPVYTWRTLEGALAVRQTTDGSRVIEKDLNWKREERTCASGGGAACHTQTDFIVMSCAHPLAYRLISMFFTPMVQGGGGVAAG